MPKFSQIPTNASPALADFQIGVTVGNVDYKVTNAVLAALISANLSANSVKSSNMDYASFGNTAAGGQTAYTPTRVVGFSSTTLNSGYYFKIGKFVFVNYYITGTSNSGSVEFDLPAGLPAKSNGGLAVEANSGLIINNGGVVASGQRVYVDPATDPLKVVCQYGFVASGSKTLRGQFFYETT